MNQNASEKTSERVSSFKKERFHLLDTIRGVAVTGMVFFHVVFDLPDFFTVDVSFVNSNFSQIMEQVVRIVFIFLSGYCCLLGHRPLKRGLTVSAAGLLVTIVSIIAKVDPPIIFGVLTLIGACMLLSIPFRKIQKKEHFLVLCFVSLTLFILTLHIAHGYFGPLFKPLITFPEFLYSAKNPFLSAFTAFFGFPGQSFDSSDYFPLMPWFFLFMSGFGLYGWLGEKINKLPVMKLRVEPFTFLGKNALWVYLLHQPLVIGILWGILLLLK